MADQRDIGAQVGFIGIGAQVDLSDRDKFSGLLQAVEPANDLGGGAFDGEFDSDFRTVWLVGGSNEALAIDSEAFAGERALERLDELRFGFVFLPDWEWIGSEPIGPGGPNGPFGNPLSGFGDAGLHLPGGSLTLLDPATSTGGQEQEGEADGESEEESTEDFFIAGEGAHYGGKVASMANLAELSGWRAGGAISQERFSAPSAARSEL